MVLRLPCAVKDYRAYKAVWNPYLRDDFSTKHQRNNLHDEYAIAVLPLPDTKVAKIVGRFTVFCPCTYLLYI